MMKKEPEPAYRICLCQTVLFFAAILIATGCASGRRAVEFDFVKHQVLAPVMVNGNGPYLMLLDTGVDPSVIDIAVAAEAGVKVDQSRTGEASGSGEGRGLAVSPALIEHLQLGATEAKDIPALGADLTSFSTSLQRRLGGILGYSFFEGRRVEINYGSQTVRILRKDEPIRADYSIPLQFVLDDTIPLIRVLIGDVATSVSLDTGSSLGLELYASHIVALGLPIDIRGLQEEGDALGARGRISLRKGILRRIEFGPFELCDVPLAVSEKEVTGRAGNVGNQFLQHFIVTLDYQSYRIHFSWHGPTKQNC